MGRRARPLIELLGADAEADVDPDETGAGTPSVINLTSRYRPPSRGSRGVVLVAALVAAIVALALILAHPTTKGGRHRSPVYSTPAPTTSIDGYRLFCQSNPLLCPPRPIPHDRVPRRGPL